MLNKLYNYFILYLSLIHISSVKDIGNKMKTELKHISNPFDKVSNIIETDKNCTSFKGKCLARVARISGKTLLLKVNSILKLIN